MNTPATKPTTLTDKVIAIVLVVWLLFFGGFGTITKLLRPSTIAPIATTIGDGARRISDQASAAAPAVQPAEKPARLPVAPRRGVGAPISTTNDQSPAVATARPTLAPTVAPKPTTAAVAKAAEVPSGQHTLINPDGSFTIDNGNIRYYPDSTGAIVETRLIGSEPAAAQSDQGLPPEQKIFLNAATPEDAAYLQTIPTATPSSITPCAGRHGCPKP
jgi:hypothetical protein